MSRPDTGIPYRCSFCREQLRPARPVPADYVCRLLLLRRYQCPHCFESVYRPFAWIARLPLIGRFVAGRPVEP